MGLAGQIWLDKATAQKALRRGAVIFPNDQGQIIGTNWCLLPLSLDTVNPLYLANLAFLS